MNVKSLRRHALAALSVATASFGLTAMAQAENLQPNVIMRFSGYAADAITPTGDFPGGYPVNGRGPQIGADGKLHGFLSISSTLSALGDQGYFEVSPDGTGYKRLSTGNTIYGTTGDADGGQVGLVESNLLSAPDGTLYGRTNNGFYNKSLFTLSIGRSTVGGQFKIVNGVIQSFDAVDASTGAAFYDANYRPFGQSAMDSQGNIYFGSTGSGTMASRGAIWRMNASDQKMVKLVDMSLAMYNDPTSPTSLTLSTKGSAPQSVVWSEADQALYVVMLYGGSATNTASGKVTGTLIRIPASTFVTDGTGTSPVEVLHNFDPTADGYPGNSSWPMSLVESGDWIYGTTIGGLSLLANQNSRIWRYKKGCVSTSTASCLSIVHAFANDNAGTANADGAFPTGPLVLAADGNIYGTAQRSADKTGTASGQTVAIGDGAIFRIKPGTAADRSDDSYEIVHRFDKENDGALPTGLTVGPVSNGVQKLYGATRYGGSVGSTTYVASTLTMALIGTGGTGTVYSIDVDAPQVAFTSELTASSKAVTVGDSINLSWATQDASTCTASGAWTDTRDASGSNVAVTVSQEGENIYTLSCEDVYGGTATSSVTVTASAKPAADGGSSGGGPLSPWLLAPLAALAALAWRRRKA